MKILLNKTNYALIILSACLLSPQWLSANDKKEGPEKSFYDEGRGWFWYEEEIVEEPAKKEKIEQLPPVSGNPGKKSPKVFSVEWIKEQEPIQRLAAINEPTRENVAAWMYLNRMTLDKGHMFSNKFRDVVKMDPLLQENDRYPFDSVAKVAMNRKIQVGTKEIIRQNKDKFGIWYFFDKSCDYCHRQIKILRNAVNELGLNIDVISKDYVEVPKGFGFKYEKGQFEKLGLKVTPALVMAMPPKELNIISQGLISNSEFEKRIVLALANNNMVNDEMLDQINPMDKGVIDNSTLVDSGISELDGSDPASWLPALRRAMGVEDDLYDFKVKNEMETEKVRESDEK